MMDAIERCLDLLDEPTMIKLIPQLTYTIRKAVGMPSKVGCSRVLVTLVVRHSFVTKPHANELLKAVSGVILDRNDAVSTSWAVAAGYLCRLCSQDRILALVDLARRFWFEHEGKWYIRYHISNTLIRTVQRRGLEIWLERLFMTYRNSAFSSYDTCLVHCVG